MIKLKGFQQESSSVRAVILPNILFFSLVVLLCLKDELEFSKHLKEQVDSSFFNVEEEFDVF